MDILILVEHVDRELDVACMLKAHIRRERPDLTVEVANFYTEAQDLIANVDPRLVVLPFIYGVDDLVMNEYVAAWSRAEFLNLAWEQILYGTQQKLKRPRDAFVRDRVHHLAWSQWYADYLRQNGVGDARIHWFGHMLYDLYDPQHQGYYASREQLAQRYGMNARKRWLFFPENFRWAFMSDQKLERMAGQGADLQDLRDQRDYCVTALAASAEWLAAAAKSRQIEVIFRPRPAVNSAEIKAFFAERRIVPPANFRVIKSESVREWVLASDVVISSNSTSLIEAAVVGKPIYRVSPLEMPACLKYEWCDWVPEIKARLRMLSVALGDLDHGGAERVRAWAQASFRVGEGAVREVARLMIQLSEQAKPVRRLPGLEREGMRPPVWLRYLAPVVSPETRHALREKYQLGYFFTYATHEKDLFDRREVERRTRNWLKVIDRHRGRDRTLAA